MDVQKKNREKIVTFFRQAGLSTDDVSVYLYLLENGTQTVLSLSRGLKTGRTRLYPLLDKLSDLQLVSASDRHSGTVYTAEPPEASELLVNKAEKRSHILRDSLPSVQSALKSIARQTSGGNIPVIISDLDDYKQLYWDAAKSGRMIRIWALPQLQRKLDPYFVRKLLAQSPGLEERTRILANRSLSRPGVRKTNQKTHLITDEICVYGDRVATINYLENTISGSIISNPALARLLERTFDEQYDSAL